MPALPPKADIAGRDEDVRFVPIANKLTVMDYTAMKFEKPNLDQPQLPPKADRCGLR
jgi:hypothetical protein